MIARRARLGLVVSHLWQEVSALGDQLLAGAEVLELRRPFPPGGELDRRLPPDRPRYFHWGLGPVNAEFIGEFLRQDLAAFMSRAGVELFSFDLGPAARRHSGPLPLTPALSADEILRVSDRALRRVRSVYRGRLAAENFNFYPTPLYDHITTGAFIRRYLTELDLGLVLDLAHAMVTAHNLEINLRAYLESLPLERVVELHLSRPFLGHPWAADAHGPPGPCELARLDTVLRLLPAGSSPPVFIEYYGHPRMFAAAQKNLADFLSGERPHP